jgi:hypothetical protein
MVVIPSSSLLYPGGSPSRYSPVACKETIFEIRSFIKPESTASSIDPEGDQLRYDVAKAQIALTMYELSKLPAVSELNQEAA